MLFSLLCFLLQVNLANTGHEEGDTQVEGRASLVSEREEAGEMGRTMLRQGDGIISLVFLKGHPTKKKKKGHPTAA